MGPHVSSLYLKAVLVRGGASLHFCHVKIVKPQDSNVPPDQPLRDHVAIIVIESWTPMSLYGNPLGRMFTFTLKADMEALGVAGTATYQGS